MRFVDIIEKKKNKEELTDDEIKFWIDGVTDESIPDYQTSALLMAIVLNGMTDHETAKLAECMMNSGDVIDLSDINGIKADKHSTGGVGDKTSLALGPIISACGLKLAKMSGRGLGHTGGTLDKLESIEGFNVFLKEEDFKKQVNEIGFAIIGQTGELVPADKKLYALRDVTATVDSIPLIASSIMSKKLASGSDTILLDVKYGEGAFMHTIEDAKKLANAMINIGKKLGKDTKAMITDMNQPLGNTIGNALEVKEAIETVKGNGPKDFTELVLTAGEIMLVQGKIAKNKNEARAMLEDAINSGKAFEKLKKMVEYQGGNVKQIEDPDLLPQAKFKTQMKSQKEGYIDNIHSMNLGILSMKLGGGREKKEDNINYAVGLEMKVKKGDKIKKDDILSTVYHDKKLTDEWIEKTVAAIHCEFPDCAITLSLGEKSREAYERFFRAGANRYLLRHETHNEEHYRKLHPEEMSLKHRLQCLQWLKEIGYQTGTGIMVGTPGQTLTHLVEDLLFIEQFQPQMIGIGPFIPHHDTPFGTEPAGSVGMTLKLLSLFRLMHPSALIPSTTALATLSPDGREKGILAGANVVMPNLSPREQREKYTLYDNKAAFGAEAAEGLRALAQQLETIGYRISTDRGDYH